MSEYKDYGYSSANPTYVLSYITDPILKSLNKDRNSSILDLGCGNGALVRFLLEKGFNAYGTDASVQGITIAQALNPDRFAVQDLSSDALPSSLRSEAFNTIIATEVIEHLYDPRKFVRFAKNILIENGGGDIIITTPYHGYLKNLLIAVTGKWDSHANPLWDGGHIKLWSKKTLSALLAEHGFRITHFQGCGRLPFFWKSMLIKAEI